MYACGECNDPVLDYFLSEHENEIFTRIRKTFYNKSMTMLYTASLSTNQWETIREGLTVDGFKFLPCYKTIQNHWRTQNLIPDFVDNQTFFEMLENGRRVLLSENENQFRITLSNRVKWILFLIATYLNDHMKKFLSKNNLPIDSLVEISFQFLLWGDGGRLWGFRNGLFSAIKG